MTIIMERTNDKKSKTWIGWQRTRSLGQTEYSVLGGDVGARTSRPNIRRGRSQVDNHAACFATLRISTANDSWLLRFHGGGFGTDGEVRALYISLQYALKIVRGTLCDISARFVCDLGLWGFSMNQQEAGKGARDERIRLAD